MTLPEWKEGLADICSAFQLDLSCLVDGEIGETAGARAMLHLEECACCRDFLDDTRVHARLHQEMADPDRLFARVAMLTGTELSNEIEKIDTVHRLATIFYQLGKAYILAAIDPDYRERIFEAAVPASEAKIRGRGFVDGVLLGGKDQDAGVDWRQARNMLNGRLERIEDPLEKGRRLLLEAIALDPSHEEARLYLAYLYNHEGKRLRAAEAYRDIFDTAVCEVNRAHAAIQLGRLYFIEDNHRKAIVCWRWVTMSGLGDSDDRFWFVRFNIGKAYATDRQQDRALASFRLLLDRHPDRVSEVAVAFEKSPKLRRTIENQAGFTEALLRRCPELFQSSTQVQADI